MHSMKVAEKSPPVAPIESDYGYGTQLHLEPSQVAALGLSNIEPGTKVRLGAIAEVKHLNISKDGGGTETRICLQITEMEAKPQEKNETADALYGGTPDQGDGGSGMFGSP